MQQKQTFLDVKIDIEKKLIGSMLDNPSWFDFIAGKGVQASTFSDLDCKNLFIVMKGFNQEKRRFLFNDIALEFKTRTGRTLYPEDWSKEFQSLSRTLPLIPDEYRSEEENFLEKLGQGIVTRAEFQELYMSKANLDWWVETFLQYAERLRIHEQLINVASKALAVETEVPFATLKTEISSLNDRIKLETAQELSTFEKFEQLGKRPYLKELNKFLTGFVQVDELIESRVSSSVVVLGARPGGGKTSFALQAVFETLKTLEGNEVALYFSLEANDEEILNRLFQLQTGLIVDYGMEYSCATKLVKQLNSFTDTNRALFEKFHIRSSKFSIDSIVQECRAFAVEHKIRLVVVDYLQLVKGDEKNPIREQVVSKISRQFKELSMHLDCHVLLLSQVNRAVENRAEKILNLADLRESGSIEQDANVVIFLNKDPDQGTIVEVAKNRYGRTGRIRLGRDTQKAAFKTIGGVNHVH